MAHIIELRNINKNLRVDVAPYNGGMITQINLEGIDILHMNMQSLETIPMLSGGMPFLFPFSSKTENDTYMYGGNKYHMPMHGLVKNSAFAVKKKTSESVTLWIENNSAWKEDCFPFDFHIENEYKIVDNSISVTTSITNNGTEPMPHSFGWHPFFKSTHKKETKLTQYNTTMYDYINKIDICMPRNIALEDAWDNVFHSPTQHNFELINYADNYKVKCEFDEKFKSLVVCTWVENSLCIEPWCGIPDSINSGIFLNYIKPNQTEVYSITLEMHKLS